MSDSLTGGCECGGLRYAISGDPLATVACHCTQCQRQSGSAFSMSLVVPRDAFAWTRGEPSVYTTTADSGAEKECIFCRDCGVRICNRLSSMPATANVKPGTLDDASWLEPIMHVWVSSKQPWTPIPADVKQFEKNPVKPGSRDEAG